MKNKSVVSETSAPGKRRVKLPKLKAKLNIDPSAKTRAPKLRLSTGRKK